MKVEIFESFDESGVSSEEWNALVEADPAATIFQSYEWCRAWWETFSSLGPLRLIVARSDKQLQAIAPLYLHKEKINGLDEAVLRFLGDLNRAADYCDLILRDRKSSVLQDFLLWIVDNEKDWSIFEFFNLPDESSTFAFLNRDDLALPYFLQIQFLYDTPSLVFHAESDYRNAINKKSLKRHTNYFRRTGTLAIQHLEDRTTIETHLPLFFQQHVERRKLAGGESQFLQAPEQDFYRALLKWLDPKGALSFSVVTHDEKPIAFHLGFVSKDRFLWYKPTFDTALAKHSPGEVLLRFLLEYTFEKGLREFDFTAGGEAFKYRFANTIRKNYQVRIYRRKVSVFFYQTRRRLAQIKNTLFSIGKTVD